MTPAEEAYASALAGAIAADLHEHPVPRELVRVVVRWSEGPGSLTVHALGVEEARYVAAGDSWLPLEWPGLDGELERTDRVLEDPALAEAVEALDAEVGEDGWEWDEAAMPAPLLEAARRLPDALRTAGVLLDEDLLAVGVEHFEGWGAARSVEAVNPPHVLEALREEGILPVD